MSEMTTDETEQGADKMIQREDPNPPQARAELVKKLCANVRLDKKRWDKAFERMRKDQAFARKGADKSWADSERYIANIVQRHLSQRVSALYAKNPKFVARRKDRMDFAIWDENPESLQAAVVAAQTPVLTQDPLTGAVVQTVDPAAMELLADVMEGFTRRKMYEKLARTLEIVFKHQLAEQTPPFKRRMKALVRRTVTCGVGYVKLGIQRAMERNPDMVDRIADVNSRLAHLEQIMADLHDEELTKAEAEVEELRLGLETLQSEEYVVANEGLTFDFPKSPQIIPDRKCQSLDGFIGCDRVTQEYIMSCEDVKAIYGKDLSRGKYQQYSDGKRGALYEPGTMSDLKKRGDVCVWEIYDKKTGQVYHVADGYADFLREPKAPAIKLQRFWPWFTLMFNEVEDEEDIFPPSDVELLRPMQKEYNRSRDGLREHRKANRPRHVIRRGALSDEDKDLLESTKANSTIELDGLGAQQKVDDLLQPLKGAPIDPNLYDTNHLFEDVLRVVGTQEANLGGTSGATATESSIAEGSRLSSLQSNIDDLDDLLTEIARAGGEICLAELSTETVQEIAGPGAVWPELTPEEITKELYLEIEAGSSGRPNRAAEIQNLERLIPLLLQIPGIKPDWLARVAIQRLDDKLDLTDAMDPGLPSITALNAMISKAAAGTQPGTGDPATDPSQQGEEGGDNAAAPAEGETQPPAPPALDMGGAPAVMV